MLIPVKQPSSAVEHSIQPSNLISAVCLSNLSYSLINVSAVATTAVFLNRPSKFIHEMRRLNVRPGSFISAFVGVDHFSNSFSLSLSVSVCW